MSAYTFTDDNDGQWSGMYLAAMCFKYAVTKDKSVLEDAWETMNSLLLLETVTEKKGFFARDYTPDPNKDRFGRPQSLEVFPYNQKRVIRWAENPFVLDEEGDGHSEQILTPWLLPYWMGRFLGVIE